MNHRTFPFALLASLVCGACSGAPETTDGGLDSHASVGSTDDEDDGEIGDDDTVDMPTKAQGSRAMGTTGSTGSGDASGATTGSTGSSTSSSGAAGGDDEGGSGGGSSTSGGGASGPGDSSSASSGGAGGDGANGSSSASGGGLGGNGSGGGASATDLCPAPNGGVTWQGQKRFMYGINYAWDHYGGDFGGIAQWGQAGVTGDFATHTMKLAEMHDHGVNVIRWWMFPEFRGQGVTVDASGTAVGLGATTLADVVTALELANAADVNVMLTLFSFDGFRQSGSQAGLYIPGITQMVTDPAKRAALIQNVVRPIAKAVQASPHAARMLAWDVINEPEWATTGPGAYGDPAFEPNGELIAVSHAQMETFISEVTKVLREESTAMITVGAAAFKWAKAWSKIDQDFYQFHMYDWIDQYWPYTGSPTDYGLADKPLVMGEFPLGQLAGTPYADVVSTWWNNGYAGAMGWQYDGAPLAQLQDVKTFADQHSCETRY